MSSEESLPQALLFDLDDTILADSECADECWMFVCEKYAGQIDIEPAALYQALLRRREWYWSDPERHRIGRADMRSARREIVRLTFADEGIHNSDVALLLADEYTDERLRRLRPFPDALVTLEELARRDIPMALVTNGDGRLQRYKIERFDLARFFTCIVVESEFGAGKPDAAVFQHALSRLGRQPSEVWMVGDNLAFDIAPAQALGISGVWVDHRRGGLPLDSKCIPWRTVQSIGELLL